MKMTDKYFRLDVHKHTIVVALADSGRSGKTPQYGKVSNDLRCLEKLLPKLGSEKV